MNINRTNTRRLLSFVLAVLFVFQVVVLFSDAKAQTETDYYERLMVLQENAVQANEKLNEAFGFDENGSIQFPSDFSGVWIDGSNLVVSLIDVSEENQAKYRAWAGEYAGCLRFEQAEYSYSELQNAGSAVVSELRNYNSDIHVSEWYVSEKENEIVIGVDDVSASILKGRPMLSTLYDYPVEFIVTEAPTATTNVRGGNSLYNQSSACTITAGCCGTYQGSPAVLSCGHGQKGGDTIRYYAQTGYKMGNVVYHHYAENVFGDFEFISVDTSGNMFTTTNEIEEIIGHLNVNYYSIEGTSSDVAVGSVVKFYGEATHYVGYGTVDIRNATIRISIKTAYGIEEITSICGLSRINVLYGNCNHGDSGGPVFIENSNGGVNFCGVINAKNSESELPPGYLGIYFTPYTYMRAAGFTVKDR